MEEKLLNFDIIKHGSMELYCKGKELSCVQKQFTELIKDPIFLSLLNLYLLENMPEFETEEQFNSFMSKLSDDFPEWIKNNGYDNL